MANGEHWFEDMAKALKRREHAVNMVTKWTALAAEAQVDLEKLAAQVPAPAFALVPQMEQEQNQVQETVHDSFVQ